MLFCHMLPLPLHGPVGQAIKVVCHSPLIEFHFEADMTQGIGGVDFLMTGEANGEDPIDKVG